MDITPPPSAVLERLREQARGVPSAAEAGAGDGGRGGRRRPARPKAARAKAAGAKAARQCYKKLVRERHLSGFPCAPLALVWTAAALAAAILAAPFAARGAAVEPGDAVTALGGSNVGARVNWTRGVILGRGFAGPDLRAPSVTVGRIGAERAARTAAQSSLCQAVREVPVEPGTPLLGRSQSAPRPRLDALCTGLAKVADLKVFSDGAVEVLLEAPLSEVVAAAQESALPSAAPRSTLLIQLPRGAKVRPALSLKLVDEGGAPLAQAGPEGARYALTEAAARRATVGKTATLKALRTGPGSSLVVPRADYAKEARALGAEAPDSLRLIVVGDVEESKR